ncbi:hypothetical protein [Nocardiopsis coralliicola]
MVTVAIQPSYGNAAAQYNWTLTLDKEVDFSTPERDGALTDEQRRLLTDLHPNKRAKFWGTPKVQDRNMAKLRTGDIVVFTGKKKMRAVGRIGVIIENAEFADTLWRPDPEKGSWCNVYSLTAFEWIGIGYEAVWALPGFKSKDNFMGMRVLSDELGQILLEGLGIEVGSPEEQLRDLIEQEEKTAERFLQSAKVIDPERVRTRTTTYEKAAGGITLRRAEGLLLDAYMGTLHDVPAKRTSSSAGISDLYLRRSAEVELIEAKSGSSRQYVRAALAQLLDYAPHAPEPPDRVSALFPDRPDDGLIAYLHRYGIDCIYLSAGGSFERIEPPEANRAMIVKFWQPEG